MNGLLEKLRANRTLLITLAVLLILFLMAVQGMSTRDWLITTLRGLSVGAVTFLVAAGFSIILGLMDVLNLAQGTLFMIGAYVGWSVVVRPDTFLDILTPILLLIAGFMLGPLWKNLLGRLSLSRQVARIWPWGALVLAVILLAITLPRAPIAMWDHEDYNDSPIVWTQRYEDGVTSSLIVPARFVDVSPILCWLGILLASALASLGLTGLAQARSSGAGPSAARLPWGAVATCLVLTVIGIGLYWFNDELTNFMLNLDSTLLFFIAVVVATLTGASLGALMESTLIRPLYARPTYQLMLTLGMGLLGIEIVRAIWGRPGFTMPRPSIFGGTGEGCPATSLGEWLQNKCRILAVTVGGETTRIRIYNEIFVILVGLVVLIVVWLLIQRTRLGMIIRAGVQDSEMVEALGINVRQVFTLVFALGVALASLGGVLSGPSTGLSDLMGEHLLLGGLIALAIGGLTSYPGSAAGAVLVGLVQQFIIKYGQIGIKLPFLDEPFKPTPPLVPSSTVLLMIIILVVMPQGLLGRKE